jgi:hypothetical protein
MVERTLFFILSKIDIHVLSTCIALVLMSILLFPAHAQSGGGLKVIVNNERESGEVCVFSASKILPCKDLNHGESEEFQFAPNAIPVGEEFQVCLEDFCVTESNSPENEPEYVTLPVSNLEETQPSGTNQPPLQETQPSGTNQPPLQETQDSGDASSLVPIFILLIAVATVIGIVAKKLSHKKKQEERHDFPNNIKERILKKQNHRCANCKRLLNVVDWDHKNGKRYDNSESNCQALCPNCHAIKTRTRR